MICDECETVAHCMKNGCVPKTTKKDEAFDPQDYIDPETGEPFNPVEQLDLFDFIAGALGVSRGTAYDMIREALAEQPAPPPECQTEAEKTAFAFGWFKALESVRQQPAQRTWVGLTDDEKKHIFLKWYGKHWAYTKQVQAVMDSVEAKLRSKNT